MIRTEKKNTRAYSLESDSKSSGGIPVPAPGFFVVGLSRHREDDLDNLSAISNTFKYIPCDVSFHRNDPCVQ